MKRAQRFSFDFAAAELERLRGMRVALIGETIIDEYVYTDAIGKSGKEPMLVCRHVSQEAQGGGVLPRVGGHGEPVEPPAVVLALGQTEVLDGVEEGALVAHFRAIRADRAGQNNASLRNLVGKQLVLGPRGGRSAVQRVDPVGQGEGLGGGDALEAVHGRFPGGCLRATRGSRQNDAIRDGVQGLRYSSGLITATVLFQSRRQALRPQAGALRHDNVNGRESLGGKGFANGISERLRYRDHCRTQHGPRDPRQWHLPR